MKETARVKQGATKMASHNLHSTTSNLHFLIIPLLWNEASSQICINKTYIFRFHRSSLSSQSPLPLISFMTTTGDQMGRLSPRSLFSRRGSSKQVPASKSPSQNRVISTSSSCTRLFQPNTEEMKRVFAKFDGNGDGKLSAEELERVLKALGRNNSQAEVMEMLQVADTDCDGFIDFKEFMDVIGLDGGVKESEIESAFHVFDLDGNGRISGEELHQVLKRLGERCSLEECKRMVKGVDKNGDGQVDIQAFKMMMTKNMKMVH